MDILVRGFAPIHDMTQYFQYTRMLAARSVSVSASVSMCLCVSVSVSLCLRVSVSLCMSVSVSCLPARSTRTT